MPKIVYGLRPLRFAAQQKLGRAVSMQEVADGVTAVMRELSGDQSEEMGRVRLNNLELGKASEVKRLEMLALCTYYSRMLDRKVDTNEIWGYELNGKRVLEPAFG
jgi:hypothetical protein